MDNEVLTQADSVVETVLSQIEVILAMLTRPVMLRQILAILIILFLSWILPEGVRRWRKRHEVTEEETDAESKRSDAMTRERRWLAALYHLLAPISALALLVITIWLFNRQGYPSGLLENFVTLIWIWIAYRTLLTVLYARYGEAARPYQVRIIIPLFVLLIVLQLVAALPGSVALGELDIDLGVGAVNLNQLFIGLIVLYVFIVIAWVVEQLMIRALPNRLDAEPGVIEAFATLARYALLALGIIVSLAILGLDLTSLAIVAGGLSVGIGIGLQDLVANFVSGLVLLFEQSLKPGDVVELDGRISQVEKVALRATTVRTRTNEELIIPNANFTTNQVKNLTKSDRLVRIIIPFGVSYKSDPELVQQLAIDTARNHPLVLAVPPPIVLFRGYGESSIDFDWVVSINVPLQSFMVKSDLYYMLWKTLKEHKITIPFPQRDLNLGSGWEQFAADLGAE